MTALRVLLGAVGVVAAGYGASLLTELPLPLLFVIAEWVVAGILAHDAVIAPLGVAAGWATRRWIPAPWWRPLVVAATCTVAVALLALPLLLDRPQPVNPTLLDRDYPLAIGIALAAVWIAAAAAGLRASWVRTRTRDEDT